MKDIKEIVDQVHKDIHDAFTYTSDEKMHGVKEHWQFPTDMSDIKDDCDGFAIACRAKLREHGLDTRLVVCSTETGEMHLVCASGNYILDNRYNSVRTKIYSQVKTRKVCRYDMLARVNDYPCQFDLITQVDFWTRF